MKKKTWDVLIRNKDPKIKDISILVSAISKEGATLLVKKFLNKGQFIHKLEQARDRALRPSRTGTTSLRKKRSATKLEGQKVNE